MKSPYLLALRDMILWPLYIVGFVFLVHLIMDFVTTFPNLTFGISIAIVLIFIYFLFVDHHQTKYMEKCQRDQHIADMKALEEMERERMKNDLLK